MEDKDKSKDQLISELTEMRQRIAGLEASESKCASLIEILQKDMEWYRDMVDKANDLIQSVTPEGRFIYVNKTWQHILGYYEDEVSALTIWDIIHPDHISQCQDVFHIIMSGQEIKCVETVFIAKDGKSISVEGNVNCHFEKGKPVYTRGIFRDITERKIAEEALYLSKEHYQALIENVFDTIMVMKADGSINYVSPSIKQMLGYEPAEWIGIKIFDFIHPDEVPKLIDNINEGIRIPGYVGFMELRIQHKDGSWRTIEGVGKNLLDNPSVAGLVINCRDITERKLTEEALYLSKEYYHALIQNAFDIIMVMKADGSINYVSPSIKQMLGYEPAEWIGIKIFDFIHPDELPKLIDNFNEGVKIPDYIGFMELRLQHKNGSWRTIEGVGMNLLANPSVAGLVVNIRDVTERK